MAGGEAVGGERGVDWVWISGTFGWYFK